MGWSLHKWISYEMAFLCAGLAFFIPFFSDHWHLQFIETLLYSSFLVAFSIAFALFALLDDYTHEAYLKKRSVFRLANFILFILLVVLLLSLKNRLVKGTEWMVDPVPIQAWVYKIDPEGYRKKRTIYYTFEHEGEMFKGSQINPPQQFGIGDSLQVIFSKKNPSENMLSID